MENKMTKREASKVLLSHNTWRRRDVGTPGELQDPKLIGEAIDVAIKVLGLEILADGV